MTFHFTYFEFLEIKHLKTKLLYIYWYKIFVTILHSISIVLLIAIAIQLAVLISFFKYKYIYIFKDVKAIKCYFWILWHTHIPTFIDINNYYQIMCIIGQRNMIICVHFSVSKEKKYLIFHNLHNLKMILLYIYFT